MVDTLADLAYLSDSLDFTPQSDSAGSCLSAIRKFGTPEIFSREYGYCYVRPPAEEDRHSDIGLLNGFKKQDDIDLAIVRCTDLESTPGPAVPTTALIASPERGGNSMATIMTTPSTQPEEVVRFIDQKEGMTILSTAAKRYLNLSGEEFLSRWKSGYWPDPDSVPGVMRVAMLLPFIDSAP